MRLVPSLLALTLCSCQPEAPAQDATRASGARVLGSIALENEGAELRTADASLVVAAGKATALAEPGRAGPLCSAFTGPEDYKRVGEPAPLRVTIKLPELEQPLHGLLVLCPVPAGAR